MFHGLREDRAAHLASSYCAIDHHGHSVFRDGVGPGKSATDRVAIDRCGQSHRGFDRNDIYVFKVKREYTVAQARGDEFR